MVFYGSKERGYYGRQRSTYEPKQQHYEIAQEYGVVITPSTNKLKKLNVYKKNISGSIVGTEASEGKLATYKKAKKYQVSNNPNRSWDDDYSQMIKIAEIGGMYQDGEPYGDYYTYLEISTDRYGNDVDAEQARQRYLVRHQHENKLNSKLVETVDDEGDIKRTAIDLGSPSFWADVILWGKKANEQKIVMKKEFAELDQLSATHAITDDFEFDMSFAKIIDKRITKLKAFLQFSKKFEQKNKSLITKYMKDNEDELRQKNYYQDHWVAYGATEREWSSKFYTVAEFKNKNIERIRQLYFKAKTTWSKHSNKC